MPTLKIDQTLFLLDGKTPMTNGEAVVYLKDVICDALMTPNPDAIGSRGELLEKGDEDKVKYHKWELFKKFRDAETTVDLKNEDVVFILKWIAKYQSQLVYGQCADYLEQ